MAHIALYRTWRSKTFSEIVGQKHIVQTLQNALKEDRISHAYLFCGPRGTGKTSTAKIFAKALNCIHGAIDEPCNSCSFCQRISEGSFMDIIEIDAASNRGIEEIRDLRDQVKFAPTEAKYKVYIIDEVHMLTTEAFNALLKTLEEPPSHIIFIFATTEAHKLPLTVISRCQRYDFRRVAIHDQIQRLQYVCEREQITIEQDALHYIARLSDGGMRDALSLLDQLTSFCSGAIEVSDVISMTGGVPSDQIERLIKAIKGQQLDIVLEIIDSMMQEGKSADRCLDQVVDYYRDLLLVHQIPQSSIVLERIFDVTRMLHIAEWFSVTEIFQTIEILIQHQSEMKYAVQPQTILEMALMKVSTRNSQQQENEGRVEQEAVHSQHTDQWQQLTERIHKLETQIIDLKNKSIHDSSQTMILSGNAQTTQNITSHTKASLPFNKTVAKLQAYVEVANSPETTLVNSKWNQILSAVKSKKVTVHAWLVNGDLVSVNKDEILLAFKNEMHKNTTEKPENKQIIEEVVSQVLEKSYRLITVMRKEWDDAQSKDVAEIDQKFELQHESQPTAENEEWIREAIHLFGEDIVEIKED
jgi:DNA polymerase-3 subunit gamma/tau